MRGGANRCLGEREGVHEKKTGVSTWGKLELTLTEIGKR